MCTTSAIPNISLSWCICIECENCIQGPQLKYVLQDLFIVTYMTLYVFLAKVSKQLNRKVQEMKQIPSGGNVVGKTG